ncbi:MAG TPA: UDP-N-acetylglucosamine 2-epimerase (non-hydrolyzing), partial [Oligoflexia bacterium]|nr:UDP-N-acetylglucosamine 2-epimerase (non-hydrolyzing) [Oligoflexia bacterium]
MKIAPLVRAFQRRAQLEQLIVHTGQHYDSALSGIFFQELGIPDPDINLDVGSSTREEQIARIEEKFDEVIVQVKPDVVVVVGDVNSTVGCARAAKRRRVCVVHVEAGLRSFDLTMPEEHNRRETDELSDFLFVTEKAGMTNLAAEEVKGRAFLVGNVMIDSLVFNLPAIRSSCIMNKLGLSSRSYAVATFHRPVNVDSREKLGRLIDAIRAISAEIPLLLPIHPRTKKSLETHNLWRSLQKIDGLILQPPLGYMDFMRLVMDAKLVITDSGGIQEETTFLGIPCITMRESTERPATVDLGTNVVVGSFPDALLEQVRHVLADRFKRGH